MVRFVALPDEWAAAIDEIPDESVDLMRFLIGQQNPSRIDRVDEYGQPWIDVQIPNSDGSVEQHTWAIQEHSGWVRVES